MPQTIKQEDGTEVEVFTKDEVDAERDSAIEAYKSENPDQSDKVQELETSLTEAKDALATAQEELKAADEKDQNFAELRKKANEAEQQLAEVTKDLDNKLAETKKSAMDEVLETVNQGHFHDTLNDLSGGDKDLKEKIEKEYSALNDPATNKEEITSKLNRAYTLATGQNPNENALNTTVLSSGGVTKPQFKEQDALPEEAKELGRKFGLKEEDFNKYGN